MEVNERTIVQDCSSRNTLTFSYPLLQQAAKPLVPFTPTHHTSKCRRMAKNNQMERDADINSILETKVNKTATQIGSLQAQNTAEASYMQEGKQLSRERKKQEEPPKNIIFFHFLSTCFVGSSSTSFYIQMQNPDS